MQEKLQAGLPNQNPESILDNAKMKPSKKLSHLMEKSSARKDHLWLLKTMHFEFFDELGFLFFEFISKLNRESKNYHFYESNIDMLTKTIKVSHATICNYLKDKQRKYYKYISA